MNAKDTLAPKLLALVLGLALPATGSAQFHLLTVAHVPGLTPGQPVNFAGLVRSGSRAFVANWSPTNNLIVFDVADPRRPIPIAATAQGYSSSVAVAGPLAFVTGEEEGLRVYDVANPSNAVLLAHVSGNGLALGVAAAGVNAYVANWDGGLHVYDASTATNPVKIAGVKHGSAALGVTLAGGRAYVADLTAGLLTYDLANPTNPVLFSASEPTFGTCVAVAGARALLGGKGARLFDLTPITQPTNLATMSPTLDVRGVALAGDHAFLACQRDGLYVFDLATPTRPVPVAGATFTVAGSASSVAVAGNFVWLANGEDGLRVLLLMPQLVAQPTLTNTLALSWPEPLAPGFVLQRSDQPAGPNWTTVTNAQQMVNRRRHVVRPLPEGREFFRLHHP